MKTNLLFAVLLLSNHLIFAQARGNYEESRGNYDYGKSVKSDNYNYNPAPVTVPDNIPVANYPNTETIVLNIKGISNQKAADYVAIFSITQMGRTAEETDKLLQIRYDGFLTELQKLGIKKEEIYLDMVSFVPLYEYEAEKKIFSPTTFIEKPKGFEIQQNVHIHYKDGNLLNKIVSAAAKNEIYDIVKVDYTINNQEQVKIELQQKCISFLNEKLKEYEKMGVKLDTMMHTIAEASFVDYPSTRYSSYAAYASSSLDSERGKVNNARKVTTQFYDKVPYNTFDVVVNPVIVEPEIQFMYDLKVTYVVKKPVTPATPKKEFILINPQGTTSTLKLE